MESFNTSTKATSLSIQPARKIRAISFRIRRRRPRFPAHYWRHMKKRTLFVALMVMLAIAGCRSGSSPTATFKAFFEAQQKKDVAGMKKNLSKTSLAIMEKSAKEQNMTIDDAIKQQLESPASKTDKIPETRNEKINGNEATLELHNEDTNKWDTMYFAKEDGAWKIALDRTIEEMLRKTGAP